MATRRCAERTEIDTQRTKDSGLQRIPLPALPKTQLPCTGGGCPIVCPLQLLEDPGLKAPGWGDGRPQGCLRLEAKSGLTKIIE